MSHRAGAPEPLLERRHFVVFLALVGLGLLLATVSVRSPERVTPLEQAGLSVTGPLARAGSALSRLGADAWHGLGASWHAHHQFEAARVEVRDLRLILADRQELATENQRLRRLLALQERLPPVALPALVVHREQAPDCILVVNRGSADGLQDDAPVVSPDGVVGKVLSVTEHLARIQCVIDPNAGVAVLVGEGRGQANAIVKDAANGYCRLSYIDRLEPPLPGEVVVTSGLDLIYPKGLLVGTVVAADVERDGSTEIVLAPAVDFGRLEEVIILLPGEGQARR